MNKIFKKTFIKWRFFQIVSNLIKLFDKKNKNVLLLIPSDPWHLIGAKGDEAMMLASIQKLQESVSFAEIYVITATPMASQAASDFGYSSLCVWQLGVFRQFLAIFSVKPSHVIVLGADVMDGYYNSLTSLKMLAMADLSVRMGAKGSVMGFSFNNNPNYHMKIVFNSLTKNLVINIRDSISHERFKKFTSLDSAILVKDVAFLLKPINDRAETKNIERWAENRKKSGDIVMGFNVHPMLFKNATAEIIEKMNAVVVNCLKRILKEKKVSIILISHDYRGGDGDDICLSVIAEKLLPEFSDRVLYPLFQMKAAELKAVAGMVNCVITGRMHLAIAALGMGVPIAGLTYQDKFHGLVKDIGLPDDVLLSPENLLSQYGLYNLIVYIIENIDFHSGIVDKSLSEVVIYSRKNIACLSNLA